MKDRNIFHTITEIIWEIGVTLFAIAVLAVFICAMFAPLFSGVFTAPISKKIWNTPGITENEISKLQSHIKMVKISLWLIAIGAWTTLIITNSERLLSFLN